ncbi:MAG: hypothetical protein ACYDCL_03510 [Myxococcales bacterium]
MSPLGLLFAWSGPWTCQSYTTADGGSTVFNPGIPSPDAGTGQSGAPSTQTTNTQIDGGVSGVGLFVVINADGGGVTLGPVANFKHNFAWIANNDGTLSVINTDTATEVGNYPAAIPVDMAGQNFCKSNPPGYGGKISNAMKCMLQNPGQESTSRTVVDLNGGVFVANRAWNGGCEVSGDQMDQPSVTHINNAIDHLSDPDYPLASCAVRCPGRNGGASLTSSQFSGAPTIAPYSGFYTSKPSLWCPDPTGTLSAQGSKSPIVYGGKQYVDPTDFCNPVNYDDCAMYTIPIGAHNGYNQYGINTQGSYLARGEVIAPNCDPLTRECDIWVGLSWGGLAVRLSGRQPAQCTKPDGSGSCWNPPGWSAGSTFYPHMPTAVVPFATDGSGGQISIGSQWNGATPYGAVVDCRGYLWGDNPGYDPDPPAGNGHMLYGIDTNAIDFTGHPTSPPVTQFKVVNPNGSYLCGSGGTVCNGLPTPWQTTGQCGSYGIAVDVQGRIWLARYDKGNGACMFDPGKWITKLGGLGQTLGNLSFPSYSSAIAAFDYPATWRSYNMDSYGAGGPSVGIVSDKTGAVFPTLFCYWGSGTGALGFIPDTGTVDSQGNETGFTKIFQKMNGWPGNCTHGIDAALDSAGNTTLWGTDDSGDAIQFDRSSGAIVNHVHVNHGGFYTYSDFTGYALRQITSPRGDYTQVFQGANSAPEFTTWKSVSFNASIPPSPQSPPTTGDDLIISVRVGNSIAQLAAATDTQVCDVGAGCGGVSCTGSNCSGAVDISSLNLQGEYLAVDFLLETPGCAGNGMYPVLYTAGATSAGPGS